MVDIQAFRGLRYDLGHVGSLSNVVAPPYDVIDAPMRAELYDRHSSNCVRLILNREQPDDDETTNRYTRAAGFLRTWRDDGTLFVEPDPALYVYHQMFDYGGQRYTRRGFMCRVRLEPFGSGNVYPHEQTHAGPKADRLALMRACRANLSQIFGMYPDPDNDVQQLLEPAIAGQTPLEATDALGVVHRVWPVTQVETIAHAAAAMGPRAIYVADGHHRYETACNYRDELARQNGGLAADHPANFVLMMCVGMSDPGMIVLPTHRVFSGFPRLPSRDVRAALDGPFHTQLAGSGPARGRDVWQQIEGEDQQETLGLYCFEDDQWVLASLTDQGRARMAQCSPEQSPQWRGLGVAILHRLVVESLLEIARPGRPEYIHQVDELIRLLDRSTPDQFQLAALVMPASVEHISQISGLGERMPAKSTYFYPKVLSGLVINPLC